MWQTQQGASTSKSELELIYKTTNKHKIKNIQKRSIERLHGKGDHNPKQISQSLIINIQNLSLVSKTII